MSSTPLRVGFAIPGDSETVRSAVSGGYEYDRRLLAGLPDVGVEVELISLPRAFPAPTLPEIAATTRALMGFDGPLLIDGLSFCAIEARTAQAIGPRAAALLHHPLYLEPGLTAAESAAVEARERDMLAAAAVVVVTSAATADDAAVRFGLNPEAIYVAPPGVDRPPAQDATARASGADGGLRLVSVGSVIPRKGYPALIEAMSQLNNEAGTPPWRLEIIGPLDADPDHVRFVRQSIVERGVEGCIHLRGPLTPAALSRVYREADVFVSAARLEGYGMAAAEAVAHGLPLIAASPAVWGWAPWAVRAASENGDEGLASALSAALRPLLRDKRARDNAAAASLRGAESLPRWEDAAATAAAALRTLIEEKG